ncbi:MipA/OmpV family protein [Oxalobacteraceae bacterium A2-2]
MRRSHLPAALAMGVLALPFLSFLPAHAADAPEATDTTVAGLGLAYLPEYAGADKSRLVPVPMLEKSYANGFFLSTMRGIGYQARVDGFNLSAALAYGGVREDHKRSYLSGSDALRGMGKVEGAAQLVLNASYQAGPLELSLGTTQNINHRENGATYSAGLSAPLYRSATDQVGVGLSALYGDGKHAQTYFGVTAAQSARSGYRAYSAGGGLENLTLALNWDHAIDKNWSLRGAAGVTHLTGDAADSPLTKRKTSPLVMLGFGYKF